MGVLILVRLGTVAVAVAVRVWLAVAVGVVDAVHVRVAVVVLVCVWVRLTVGDLMTTNVGKSTILVATGSLVATGVLLPIALSVLDKFAHCVAIRAILVPFNCARRVLVAFGAAMMVALALAVATTATAVWSRLLAGIVMIGTGVGDAVGVIVNVRVGLMAFAGKLPTYCCAIWAPDNAKLLSSTAAISPPSAPPIRSVVPSPTRNGSSAGLAAPSATLLPSIYIWSTFPLFTKAKKCQLLVKGLAVSAPHA